MACSSAYDPKYALNAICPYFTMFPLEYPFRIIKKHKKEKPIVLDPFCGRGTTIYAAREFGLEAWGIDTSPIAVAVAKAKLSSATVENVLNLAKELLSKKTGTIPETEFFSMAYHPETLREICTLREELLTLEYETDESVLLKAAMLGCLHGPMNKTISGAAYFSNQMPRTFASKPDYSVRYWKKNALISPKVKVIDVLKRKLERLKNLESNQSGTPKQIVCSNSGMLETYKDISENFSLVITSPPYYGMRTYVEDQWLRMWFLGGPSTVDYSQKDQLNHNSQNTFIESLAAVWSNVYNSKSDRLDLYIRFGIVPSIKSDAKQILKASLEEAGGWRVVSTRSAKTAHEGKRQASQMKSNSNAGLEFDFHVIRS